MKKLKKYIKRLIKGIIQRFSDNSQQPSPLSSRPSSAAIPTVSPRWESGLVLVCSQCTTERSRSGSHQPGKGATASEDLQNWLKSRLKSEGLWGEFRVVSTSCLGVCPKGPRCCRPWKSCRWRQSSVFDCRCSKRSRTSFFTHQASDLNLLAQSQIRIL